MPKFTSINEAITHIKKAIDKSLDGLVAESVKLLESGEALDKVYNSYTPKRYQRRGESGGLASIDNMIHTVQDGVLIVDNQTPFNDTNPAPNYDTDQRGVGLDMLTEYGNGAGGYTYHFSRDGRPYMGPRPFVASTIEDLRESHMHTDSLIQGLKSEGIDVRRG